MSISSQVTITVAISGLTGGGSQNVGPVQKTITSTILDRREGVDLSSGFNSIDAPVGAKGVIFIPPTDNAETLTLKGVTGDTGIPLDPASPAFIPLDGTGANFGITAGGAVSDCVLQFI